MGESSRAATAGHLVGPTTRSADSPRLSETIHLLEVHWSLPMNVDMLPVASCPIHSFSGGFICLLARQFTTHTGSNNRPHRVKKSKCVRVANMGECMPTLKGGTTICSSNWRQNSGRTDSARWPGNNKTATPRLRNWIFVHITFAERKDVDI